VGRCTPGRYHPMKPYPDLHAPTQLILSYGLHDHMQIFRELSFTTINGSWAKTRPCTPGLRFLDPEEAPPCVK